MVYTFNPSTLEGREAGWSLWVQGQAWSVERVPEQTAIQREKIKKTNKQKPVSKTNKQKIVLIVLGFLLTVMGYTIWYIYIYISI